jgi:phenylalanyl-tRNA synthetase beta chain
MKITYDWLKDHLQTNKSENHLINKLTDIGLEVESIEEGSINLDKFLVAKIEKVEKHPNADRLKICDVDIGNKKILKVVCGALNAKEGLLTIYAPPGAIIPKNNMKLSVQRLNLTYQMRVMVSLNLKKRSLIKKLEKNIFRKNLQI